ncbi:MAG: hypothetical protein HUU50_20205 [Candidatus Brocadiae bacterium]|nr:hypothetical protein [Candidatus Brocadiia bacterium]
MSHLVLSMCTYMDGKHESLIQFQSEFPNSVNQYAREKNLPLEGRIIRLVGCDDMSRKRGLYSNFPMYEIGEIVEEDAIFDRIGTIVQTGGIFLDKAVYSGTQVFNRPVSIDESKARDYMIAKMKGFYVPRTVLMPQASYSRFKAVDENRVDLDVDLEAAVRYVGGYPCYMKRAFGGGRAHVYKIKNKAELYEIYQITRDFLMVLQENIDMDVYIRTFCFGSKVIHTSYNIDKPDGQKYGWPPVEFTEGDRMYLDKIMPALCQELLTPFCTMEIAKSKKDGKWYFIDITNGCNFDMREGELSSPIYKVAKQTIIEELVNWTLQPRPMIVHTNLQEHVLRQQLYRAVLKGQNPEYLLKFAKEIGMNLDQASFNEEQKRFADEYIKQYGN